jgi:Tfp pilus assembly protein PilV
MSSSTRGQSLFEIVVAVGVAAIIIGSAATVMVLSMRSSEQNAESQKGYAVAQDILDTIRSYAESSWATLYNNSPSQLGLSQQFYLLEATSTATSTALAFNTGTTTVSLSENDVVTTYTVWFTIANIYRDDSNTATTTYSPPPAVTEDPTTLETTAFVNWEISGETKEISLSQQIARTRSDVMKFSQWGTYATTSGGVSVTSEGESIYVP